METPSFTTIQCKPITEHLGAEVVGVDLTKKIPTEQLFELDKAFAQYKLLLLRGSDGPSDLLVDLAKRWGDIELNPQQMPGKVGAHAKHEEIFAIKRYIYQKPGKNDTEVKWHHDHYYSDPMPKVTILKAEKLPKGGPRTGFRDMRDVYKQIPEDLRQRIEKDNLEIIYQSAYSPEGVLRAGVEKPVKTLDIIRHPIIKTSDQGEKYVHIGALSKWQRIPDISEDESEEILKTLWQLVTDRPTDILHEWQDQDLVISDNHLLLHYREAFDPNLEREMSRILVHPRPLSRTIET